MKKGFTTPELIIAIGIIGVIAVMTMPSIYNHFHGAEFETASQKLQLQLTQTLESMNADQSLIGYASTADFVNVFKTYLKTVKTCPSSDLTGCFAETFRTEEEEFALSDVKNSAFMGKKEWKSKVEGIRLNNGISLLIAYNPYCSKKNPTNCASILYDLNSIEKDNIFKGNGHSDLGMYNAAYVGGSTSCTLDIGGTCYKLPMMIQDEHSWNACSDGVSTDATDLAIMAQYGIKKCYNGSDSWTKAVMACGHVNNLPSASDVADIANYLYDTTVIGPYTNNGNGQDGNTITLNTEKVDTIFALPENSLLGIWTNEEVEDAAYLRLFVSNQTNLAQMRNVSGGYALCLE